MAAVSSTLGAPPHQTRSTVRPIATTKPSTGATGQGHIPGTVKGLPRTTTMPGATPHSARQQGSSTVLPRFGEKGTTSQISSTCNPSLLEPIKGGMGAHSDRESQTHRHSHSLLLILALASINSSTSRHLGASLPLAQACTPYYKHPRCKIIQCFSLCWTYGLIGQNQDKSGVTVFLLASTI